METVELKREERYMIRFNQYQHEGKLKDNLVVEADFEFTRDDIDDIIKDLQRIKVMLLGKDNC